MKAAVLHEFGAPNLPLVAGHEAVGRVTEVGADVGHLHKHERVAVPWWVIHQARGLDQVNEAMTELEGGNVPARLVFDPRW